MIHNAMRWLEELGLAGLWAAMFLEGSSLPFPGVVIVLAYGYLLPFSWWNTAWFAAGMSVMYSVASLIPYYIGSRFERLLPKRARNNLHKARSMFHRYGEWSVALSRPFGLGNYISYVAGMSRMRMTRYILLTMAGIYPWSFAMLALGHYFNGNDEAWRAAYQSYSPYVYLTILVGAGIGALYMMARRGLYKINS